MQVPNTNIDQSIKVRSWDSESPYINQQPFFQRYAQKAPEPSYSRPQQQYQADNDYDNMDLGFRQLKNEQIQKLKGLKSEYQQIRKITTDYIGPRYSQSSSIRSSNIIESSQSVSMAKNKGGGSNGYMIGSRETQILQLEKKQLEIMLQNSMKKIQELLHHQMEHKKIIHQLKLQRESKNYVDSDHNSIKRIFKKRQKQLYDQIKVLELQRETLLTNLSGLRQKVKYLEIKLGASDQELRKMLDQKKNYEELIRMQKDKLMNLEIQFKRQKRQFEIMEKDKNAQILQLQRSKQVKETSTEKQLKQLNTNLEEQLKTKEKRYVLLLQQIQNLQKQKNNDSKQQEAKIMTELINKTSADNSNKAFQDTINNILNRLQDLQKKPQEPAVRQMLAGLIDEENDEEYKQAQMYKLQQLNRIIMTNEQKINTLLHNNRLLQNQNQTLKVEINNLTRKIKSLQDSQLYLKDEIYKLRQLGKKTPTSNSKDKGSISTPQKEQSSQKVNYLMNTIENLEEEIKDLNDKLEQSWRERDAIDEQNRNLLTKMSKMEFEMNKCKKESEMQLTMAKKQYDTHLGVLQRSLNDQQNRYQLANQKLKQLQHLSQTGRQKQSQYVAGLKKQIEKFEREKRFNDTNIKSQFNSDLQNAKQEYKRQINQLTSKIQELSLSNRNLQEKINKAQMLTNDQPVKSKRYQNINEDSDMNPSISEAIMLGFT